MKFVLAVVVFYSFNSFSAESSLCPLGLYRVKAHHRKAYYRADGTFVKATEVQTYCKKLSASYKFWASKLKNGRPLNWSLKKEVSMLWSEEERERTLEALKELPEFLWSQSTKGIYRFAKSRDEPNPGAQIKQNIALYDSAFDEKYRLARVLAHELAHIKYDDESEANMANYSRATGWIPELHGRTIIWSGRKSGYVDKDGENAPNEDFANNIEYYLFDQKTLKETTPTAYEWIKTNYGDKLKLRGH